VWYLRVDIHVLDADGNLTDAVVLSALAALLSFRRPDVSVGGADGR
jgi:exosome complex RNA-binding protein Rrp42 (RNase PH superfamily)